MPLCTSSVQSTHCLPLMFIFLLMTKKVWCAVVMVGRSVWSAFWLCKLMRGRSVWSACWPTCSLLLADQSDLLYDMLFWRRCTSMRRAVLFPVLLTCILANLCRHGAGPVGLHRSSDCTHLSVQLCTSSVEPSIVCNSCSLFIVQTKMCVAR